MAFSQEAIGNMLLGAFLCVGTATSVVFKQQSNSVSMGNDFDHPFMQSMTMYLGEALCFLCFLAYISYDKESYEAGKLKAESEGKLTKINPLLLIIPTACDFVTSTLTFFALGLMPVSLYSMVRSGGLIVTTIFSVIFLKRKLHRHHLLGLGCIMAGLITVGIVVITQSGGDDDSQSKMIIGILILFLSFFTFSAQLIIEEKFFHAYHLNPFQAVGIEGCWGILISGAAVAIFNFVPSPAFLKGSLPNGNLEDVGNFFEQVFTMSGPNNDTPDQPLLLVMVLVGIVLILFFNAISLSITKYVSSLARNVAIVLQPFFVWMVSLIIGWSHFLYGQLIGFMIIALGTCIFNEIFEIPYFGFNLNTKKAIAKRKEADNFLASAKSMTEDDDNDSDTGPIKKQRMSFKEI